MTQNQSVLHEILNVLRKKVRGTRLVYARRAQEYEAMLHSGDPIVVAKVVRKLYPRSGDVDDLYSGWQLYSSAVEILIDKVSALQNCSKHEASQLILTHLKEA